MHYVQRAAYGAIIAAMVYAIFARTRAFDLWLMGLVGVPGFTFVALLYRRERRVSEAPLQWIARACSAVFFSTTCGFTAAGAVAGFALGFGMDVQYIQKFMVFGFWCCTCGCVGVFGIAIMLLVLRE